MRKCRKSARRQKIREGEQVRSLRPQDNGCTGTVIKASHKRDGWVYSVLFEGWYRITERRDDKLEGFL